MKERPPRLQKKTEHPRGGWRYLNAIVPKNSSFTDTLFFSLTDGLFFGSGMGVIHSTANTEEFYMWTFMFSALAFAGTVRRWELWTQQT